MYTLYYYGFDISAVLSHYCMHIMGFYIGCTTAGYQLETIIFTLLTLLLNISQDSYFPISGFHCSYPNSRS